MVAGDEGRVLTVEFDDVTRVVPMGSSIEFGREPTPAVGEATFADTTTAVVLGANDPTVSRIHGRLEPLADRWEATSTGTYVGLLIHDLESSAMLDVPVGVGPIGIGFRSALVTIPTRTRYVFRVDAPYLGYRGRQPAVSPTEISSATERVVPESACFDSHGRPLRWFQVLVALCEPRLRGPVGPLTLPSDAEIRRRLAMGTSSFDRAFSRARQELGFEPYTNMVRLAMATTAVQQGVVRPEHLALLGHDDDASSTLGRHDDL